MVDDVDLKAWFCRRILPCEPSLTLFIRRNWRIEEEVADLRQEIYERVLIGASAELPANAAPYLFTVARNHLINRAKKLKIIDLEIVADLENLTVAVDFSRMERQLEARDQLRLAQKGLERLPPRCREVIRLRKLEGLSTREVAQHMGVGIDTVEKQLTYGMRALAGFMLGGEGRITRPVGRRSLKARSR